MGRGGKERKGMAGKRGKRQGREKEREGCRNIEMERKREEEGKKGKVKRNERERKL